VGEPTVNVYAGMIKFLPPILVYSKFMSDICLQVFFFTVVLTLYQKTGRRLNMGFILKLDNTATESLTSRGPCILI